MTFHISCLGISFWHFILLPGYFITIARVFHYNISYCLPGYFFPTFHTVAWAFHSDISYCCQGISLWHFISFACIFLSDNCWGVSLHQFHTPTHIPIWMWSESKWVKMYIKHDCHISFSLSSFYRLSQCSDSAPDVTSLLTDYSSTCYTFHIYTYFRFQVFFLMFPTFTCAPVQTFTCAPVHPSTCFHFSFHVLWLCSRPFLSYYDILYFYVLSSLRSWLILTQYINRCISLVVLQFVNWHWFSSSPIFSLKFPLSSQSSLYSLVALVTIYLLRQTSDPPILRPDFWQILGY